MVEFSPTPVVLRYLAAQAQIGGVLLARHLGTHITQAYRWQQQGVMTPTHWQRAERVLTVGELAKDENPLFLLAQFSADTEEPEWMCDQDERLAVFSDGGLALSAAKAMCALEFVIDAVPVAPAQIERIVEESGQSWFQADQVAGLGPALDFLGQRVLIFEHLASIVRRWSLRVNAATAVTAA